MRWVARPRAGGPRWVPPYEAPTCAVSPCAAQPCAVPSALPCVVLPVLPCAALARYAEPLALPRAFRRIDVVVVPWLLQAGQRQVPLPAAACPFVLSFFPPPERSCVLQPVKRRRVQESGGSIVPMSLNMKAL